MNLPRFILVMIVLLPLGCADEATTKPVPKSTDVTTPGAPAKVREIVHKMAALKKGMSRRDVIGQLGLNKDESVKDLDAGGDLGEGYESYDLGINGEWVLTIDYKFGYKNGEWDFGNQEVFEVSLQRGSVSKFKKNEDQHWERFYPYWRKGVMIDKPPESKKPNKALHPTAGNSPV
jgi:hypothetical protein